MRTMFNDKRLMRWSEPMSFKNARLSADFTWPNIAKAVLFVSSLWWTFFLPCRLLLQSAGKSHLVSSWVSSWVALPLLPAVVFLVLAFVYCIARCSPSWVYLNSNGIHVFNGTQSSMWLKEIEACELGRDPAGVAVLRIYFWKSDTVRVVGIPDEDVVAVEACLQDLGWLVSGTPEPSTESQAMFSHGPQRVL